MAARRRSSRARSEKARGRTAAALLLLGLLGSLPAKAGDRGDAADPPPAAGQGNPAAPPPAAAPANAADTDPLQPIFLQFREEYSNLPDGAWTNSLTLRRDELILKNLGVERGRRGLLLRFDLPMNTVHAGSDTDTGLGDLYAQALFFPRVTRTFAVGAGTGLYFPTASLDETGSGKWSVAPLVAPIWFFPGAGAFALLKAQEVISLGGSTERPDLNTLLLTPTGVWRLGGRGWLLADTEVKRDWINAVTYYKSGVQIGTRFGNGKAAWIKVEVPYGPDRQADWIVKTSFYLMRWGAGRSRAGSPSPPG